VKNDHRDGVEWLKRMRLGELPESWIAPAGLRGLRETIRARAKLVASRSGLKAVDPWSPDIHAVVDRRIPQLRRHVLHDRQVNELRRTIEDLPHERPDF